MVDSWQVLCRFAHGRTYGPFLGIPEGDDVLLVSDLQPLNRLLVLEGDILAVPIFLRHHTGGYEYSWSSTSISVCIQVVVGTTHDRRLLLEVVLESLPFDLGESKECGNKNSSGFSSLHRSLVAKRIAARTVFGLELERAPR